MNPPPGGNVVSGCDHPGAWTTGVFTVVGVVEGWVVAGAGEVVVDDRTAPVWWRADGRGRSSCRPSR